jgi:ABC-type Co2+ transport system permease subunit
MLTGLVGTMLVLGGYLTMAMRRDPAIVFTVGSCVWIVHAAMHRDWWLLACNAATATLGSVSVIRGYLNKRAAKGKGETAGLQAAPGVEGSDGRP